MGTQNLNMHQNNSQIIIHSLLLSLMCLRNLPDNLRMKNVCYKYNKIISQNGNTYYRACSEK